MARWKRLGAWALSWAVGLGVPAASGAVEIVGSTQATFGWAAASGAVSGYYVVVSRDSQPAQVEGVTLTTEEMVEGSFGETLVVQVAAFDAEGVAGPLSEPSEPITFVEATSSGDTGSSGGTGGDDPAGSDDGSGTDPGTGTAGPAGVRDFTGDGLSDLLVREGSSLSVWAMRGAQVQSVIPLPDAPAGADLVGTGDYDANGSADLLWESPASGSLTLWRLDGGVVVGTATVAHGLPASEEWHVGGSADFDGDGADDVMLFSRVAGAVEIWSFDAASFLSQARLPGRMGAWSVTAVEDTDGDGLAEIVWVDEIRRSLEQQDPSTGRTVALGDLGEGWRGRAAVDVDGDGGSDLVMHHADTGSVQAWQLADSGIVASADLPGALGLGGYAGSGDFDGDGREDLVWAEPATGAVTLALDPVGAPLVAAVDRLLPAGGEVVSGLSGSDDSLFREHFCSGDLDGDGDVDTADFEIFKRCHRDPASSAACDRADMDSNGSINSIDFSIFKMRFQGLECDGL